MNERIKALLFLAAVFVFCGKANANSDQAHDILQQAFELMNTRTYSVEEYAGLEDAGTVVPIKILQYNNGSGTIYRLRERAVEHQENHSKSQNMHVRRIYDDKGFACLIISDLGIWGYRIVKFPEPMTIRPDDRLECAEIKRKQKAYWMIRQIDRDGKKEEFVIDKDSFAIISRKVTGANGALLLAVRYKKLNFDIEVSESTFAIPKDAKIKLTTNPDDEMTYYNDAMNEYLKAVEKKYQGNSIRPVSVISRWRLILGGIAIAAIIGAIMMRKSRRAS